MIVDKTLAAARLNTVIVKFGASAEAGFGNGEYLFVFLGNAHTGNLVSLGESYSLNASCGSAYAARVIFVKAYAHTLPCSYEYLLFAVGELYKSQFVALVEIYREYTVFADVLICVKLGTLDNAVFGEHAEIEFFRTELGNSYHGGDLFIRAERKNVDNVHSL